MYFLTPSRKTAGKALARRSKRKLVNECFSDKKSCEYIFSHIKKLIRTEIKKLSNLNSILCSQCPNDMMKIDWDVFIKVLKINAPTFLSFLMAASQTKVQRSNRNSVICICAAILLKHRFKRLNIIQKIISLILYTSHCFKKAFSRLSSLGLCVSHSTTLKLVNQLGENHDARVKKWRDDIITNELEKQEDIISATTTYIYPENNSNISSSSQSSHSNQNYSSADQDSDADCCTSSNITDESDIADSESNMEESVESVIPETRTSSHEHSTSYKLVGNNVDIIVTPRYMRTDCKVKSLHYYHLYTVKDRINTESFPIRLPSSLNDINDIVKSFLPSLSDDEV
jgi:L1 cell adhesion molecule like protein